MGVCVHGLCLETTRVLPRDSNLGAGHVKHLAKPTNNHTCLLVFSLYRLSQD